MIRRQIFHILQFVHKLVPMIEADPSSKWVYDIISSFAELGLNESQYIVQAGVLSTLLRLLEENGIPKLWEKSNPSSSNSFDGNRSTYAEKVSYSVPVQVNQDAVVLLATLMTKCSNLDAETSLTVHTDGFISLDPISTRWVSELDVAEKLMRLAFGTQFSTCQLPKLAVKADHQIFFKFYPHNNEAISILKHLLWNSPTYTKILVEDMLSNYLYVKLMNVLPLHTVFRFVVFLITVKDDLQDSRTKQVLDVISHFIRRMLDEKILRMTAYLIHHILMLCSNKVCSHICIPYFTSSQRASGGGSLTLAGQFALWVWT